MKTMKSLVLLIFLVLAMQTNAQEENLETKTAFRKAKAVEVKVDLKKTSFAGLDSLSFVEYMAGKENKPVAYVSKFFHFFRQRMIDKMNAVYKNGSAAKKYTLKQNPAAEFRLDIAIDEITENAGLRGSAKLYPKSNNGNALVYDFKFKDGRWNSFEELLYEAAEALGKDIVKALKAYTCNYQYPNTLPGAFKQGADNIKQSVKKAQGKFVEAVKENNPFKNE